MALTLPSHEAPSGVVLENAYAWIASLTLDNGLGQGYAILNIHPSIGEWQRQPADQIVVTLGERLPNGQVLPSLAELLDNPDFAAAFVTIGAVLQDVLAKTHPALEGASPFPTR